MVHTAIPPMSPTTMFHDQADDIDSSRSITPTATRGTLDMMSFLPQATMSSAQNVPRLAPVLPFLPSTMDHPIIRRMDTLEALLHAERAATNAERAANISLREEMQSQRVAQRSFDEKLLEHIKSLSVEVQQLGVSASSHLSMENDNEALKVEMEALKEEVDRLHEGEKKMKDEVEILKKKVEDLTKAEETSSEGSDAEEEEDEFGDWVQQVNQDRADLTERFQSLWKAVEQLCQCKQNDSLLYDKLNLLSSKFEVATQRNEQIIGRLQMESASAQARMKESQAAMALDSKAIIVGDRTVPDGASSIQSRARTWREKLAIKAAQQEKEEVKQNAMVASGLHLDTAKNVAALQAENKALTSKVDMLAAEVTRLNASVGHDQASNTHILQSVTSIESKVAEAIESIANAARDGVTRIQSVGPSTLESLKAGIAKLQKESSRQQEQGIKALREGATSIKKARLEAEEGRARREKELNRVIDNGLSGLKALKEDAIKAVRPMLVDIASIVDEVLRSTAETKVAAIQSNTRPGAELGPYKMNGLSAAIYDEWREIVEDDDDGMDFELAQYGQPFRRRNTAFAQAVGGSKNANNVLDILRHIIREEIEKLDPKRAKAIRKNVARMWNAEQAQQQATSSNPDQSRYRY